jgi:hypothetical protein
MPQIWMTYEELGSLLDCAPATARNIVVANACDRRKSRDGRTRVKLNAALAELFFEALLKHWIDTKLQSCASDLALMRDRMATRDQAEGAGLTRHSGKATSGLLA